jgi:lipoate-protein ligase A
VVIGRFQDAPAELNRDQCALNDVNIVRRFTGGGTVFHDEYTLNFTLSNFPPDNFSPWAYQEKNLKLVSKALNDLGLNPSIEVPNSILLEGRKVCGAAAASGKNFSLWHCSILVDTNLELLEITLAPSKLQNKSHFVHSRWRPVTSLTKASCNPVSVQEVAESLERAIQANMEVKLATGRPSTHEVECADVLYARKYSSQEWNMEGKQPQARWQETGSVLHDYGGVRPLHAFG